MSLKNTKNLSELYSSSNIEFKPKEFSRNGYARTLYFEDLYNCNYLIDRFNKKYSQNETYFWD